MRRKLGFLPLILLCSCSGRGAIHFVPLDAKRIASTGPLIAKITPDECFYWVSDDGQLCIAWRERHQSVLSPFLSRDFSMSLVLGEPPAGVTRAYPANRETLRARTDAGLTQLRAGSLSGGVLVWNFGKPVLRGRFRIQVKQQSYSALTDWSGNARVLLVGEFSATKDRPRGESILNRSEEDGLERRQIDDSRMQIEMAPTPTPPD